MTWTPDEITNLVLWLDADDSSTITLDGSNNVTQWDDKTTNAHEASDSGSPPAFVASSLNSKGGLSYSGTNGLFIPDHTSLRVTSSCSMFAVVNLDGLTTATDDIRTILSKESGWTDRNYWFVHFDEVWKAGNTGTYFESTNNSSISACVLDFISDGTNGIWYEDGSANGSAANAGDFYQQVSQVGIGRQSDGQRSWSGTIHEILLFDKTLTATEREEVEGYLAHKWGIEANLPTGHTYKSSPPSSGAVSVVGDVCSYGEKTNAPKINFETVRVGLTSWAENSIAPKNNIKFSRVSVISWAENTSAPEWKKVFFFVFPPEIIPRTSASRHHYALAKFGHIILPPLREMTWVVAQVPKTIWGETKEAPAPAPAITKTVSSATSAYATLVPVGHVSPIVTLSTIPKFTSAEKVYIPTAEDLAPSGCEVPLTKWAELKHIPTIVNNPPVTSIVPKTDSGETVFVPVCYFGKLVFGVSWGEAALVPTVAIHPLNIYELNESLPSVTAESRFGSQADVTLPAVTSESDLRLLSELLLPALRCEVSLRAGWAGVCKLNKWLPGSAVMAGTADGMILPAITCLGSFSMDRILTGDTSIPAITFSSHTGAHASLEMDVTIDCVGTLLPGRSPTLDKELPSIYVTATLAKSQSITLSREIKGPSVTARTAGHVSASLPAITALTTMPLNNVTQVDVTLPNVTMSADISTGNIISVDAIIANALQVSSRLISHQDDIQMIADLPALYSWGSVSRSYDGILRYDEDRDDAIELTPAGYDDSGILTYSR